MNRSDQPAIGRPLSRKGRYVLLMIPPPSGNPIAPLPSLLGHACVSIGFDRIEDATSALETALKRRLWGETYELMRSCGYQVDSKTGVATATNNSDVIVALAYPKRPNIHNAKNWSNRVVSRLANDKDRHTDYGPTVYYGGRAQLKLSKDVEGVFQMSYKEAKESVSSIFYMAEMAMIG